MANAVANDLDNSRCDRCGALLRMVGRSHRCVAVANFESSTTKPRGVIQAGGVSTTYKHRDPEARRAYMRDYMRARREKV